MISRSDSGETVDKISDGAVNAMCPVSQEYPVTIDVKKEILLVP